ncbi:MAG: hypothetical protein HYR56_20510 [Acidobacteria bacterium]|nr:hypothetical protein [Acidobacteriota bacterium]MBI3428415.1 hypothetical protein [Acidobacteriota bacterium]
MENTTNPTSDVTPPTATIKPQQPEAATGIDQPATPSQPDDPNFNLARSEVNAHVKEEMGEIILPSEFSPKPIEQERAERKLPYLGAVNSEELAADLIRDVRVLLAPKLGKVAGEIPMKDIADKLPYFDWRWDGVVPPARAQGDCGSCWAFVATEAFESRLIYNLNRFKLNSGKPDAFTQVTLCVQGVLNCVTNGNCGGGSYTDAFDHMVKQGARILQYDPTGGAFDDRKTLLGVKGPCTENDQRNRIKASAWDFVFIKDPLLAPRDSADILQMKVALLEHGPLAVLVRKDDNFKAYTGGVFNQHNERSVNHAVLLTGWDEERKAWIILNSSGREWGETCVDEAKLQDQFPGFWPRPLYRRHEKGCMYIAYGTSHIGTLAAWIEAPFSVQGNIIETLQNDRELAEKTGQSDPYVVTS